MVKSSPNKKPGRLRAFFLALVVAALAFGGFYAVRLLRGIELPRAPLENVPRAARVVAFVRFGTVVRSEVVRLLVRREVLDERLARFRERCHVDPASQLDDLILFVEGNDLRNLASMGVVARGPFELEKLRHCFRDAFGEEGLGETRIGEIDGVPAAIPSNSQQRAAFLGPKGIAIGEEPMIRHVISVVRDHRTSGASDPVLRRLWDRIESGKDLILVGHVPPNWAEQLATLTGSDVSTFAGRDELADIVALGVGADVSNGLGLSLTLAMRDEEKARNLLARVRSQVESLTNNVLVSLTPFGAVVRAIHTDRQGTDLLITADLPRDRLERVIEFASAWRNNLAEDRQNRAAAAGPAPAPEVVRPNGH